MHPWPRGKVYQEVALLARRVPRCEGEPGRDACAMIYEAHFSIKLGQHPWTVGERLGHICPPVRRRHVLGAAVVCAVVALGVTGVFA